LEEAGFIQVLGIFMTNSGWQQLHMHFFFFFVHLGALFIKCLKKVLPGIVLATYELWPFLL